MHGAKAGESRRIVVFDAVGCYVQFSTSSALESGVISLWRSREQQTVLCLQTEHVELSDHRPIEPCPSWESLEQPRCRQAHLDNDLMAWNTRLDTLDQAKRVR